MVFVSKLAIVSTIISSVVAKQSPFQEPKSAGDPKYPVSTEYSVASEVQLLMASELYHQFGTWRRGNSSR